MQSRKEQQLKARGVVNREFIQTQAPMAAGLWPSLSLCWGCFIAKAGRFIDNRGLFLTRLLVERSQIEEAAGSGESAGPLLSVINQEIALQTRPELISSLSFPFPR